MSLTQKKFYVLYNLFRNAMICGVYFDVSALTLHDS